jgi:tetratricopeptide (TPR) repeat protein
VFLVRAYATAEQEDPASRIYAEAAASVFLLSVQSANGDVIAQATGFLVGEGTIITNEHVIRSGSVFLDTGAARIPMTIARIDQLNDLALLSSPTPLTPRALRLANETPTPGTAIFALGNPAGLERSISTGVAAGTREISGRQLLQVTAPISPGSSGGPILNARGEVVGVAVGSLDAGQNLNFAVPAAAARRLLAGDSGAKRDPASFLATVERLTAERDTHAWAPDADATWQRLDREVTAALAAALEQAGSDPSILLEIARRSEFQSTDIAIAAADRAVRLQPTAGAYLLLGTSLHRRATSAVQSERAALLERAQGALQAALHATKQPTPEMHYYLGAVYRARKAHSDAETTFLRALSLSRVAKNADVEIASLRGLIAATHALGKAQETKTWFRVLVSTGKATAWDWQEDGLRLDSLKEYREAAQSYMRAATAGASWLNWCEAASSFAVAGSEEDAVLSSARLCIQEGSGKPNSESALAAAHRQVADVLNERGVHQEALTHAREAASLDPTDAWALDAQATALLGLRRFHEAVTAANQAIRQSDGKFASMHFNLGSAYFELENWILAKQSFEKAAEQSQGDTAAPYNVALCLVRLRYYRDAAQWYEEVLRRNPMHPQRKEILSRIEALRR